MKTKVKLGTKIIFFFMRANYCTDPGHILSQPIIYPIWTALPSCLGRKSVVFLNMKLLNLSLVSMVQHTSSLNS